MPSTILAQAAFNKIAQEQNLRIAAVTGIEPVENQDTSGADLQLTFVYETYPDIQLADFSALEIEKVVSEVGEAEVDSTIEILRNNALCTNVLSAKPKKVTA